jgi:4-hydroxy-3-methylbut-2-enyl diphosphate reductase
MGRVLLAAPRGYCAGVERAIVTVEEALRRYGPPVYVRKQIVHNTFVVGDLTRRGAVFVDELDEVPDDALVIFSAHGVSPAVKEHARERGLRTIDATCPLVTKVHKEAVRFAEVGYEIVLIGHADHEEVEGTLGEAPDHMHLVDPARPDDLHLPDDTPVGWLSQTTLSVDETMTAVRRLRERFPGLVDPPSDDICYASQNRQEAVARIAPHCDLVVVVGSSNSSNSQRLVEVALGAGARASYLVDRAADADERWLDGVETVGVSSGASVPDHLVAELLDWLAARGYTDMESVTLAEETLTFSLPQELR